MEISDNIKDFLFMENIASAMELLKQRVTLLGNWDIQSDLEKAEFSYNSMLDFMLQNYVDADVKDKRNQIILDLYAINNSLDRAERYKDNPADLYCLSIRNHQNEITLESIVGDLISTGVEMDSIKDGNSGRENVAKHRCDILNERLEELRVLLFETLWTSGNWNGSTLDIASSMIDNENIDENTRAIAVSAVTLGLLEYFDARKVSFLLDAYLSENKVVSARAIVGFILAKKVYEDEFFFCKEINDRIKLMLDDEQFADDIFFVCTQLQLSSATSSITQKMNTDILPSIMAGTNFKEAMSGIKHNKTDNDENPEWDNYKVDKKAEKKIREMADMELDGADIYYSSFRLMKNYPFFNKLAHWFYPFDIESPFLTGKESLPSTVLSLVKLSPFCSNDLYSFTMSLSGLGSMISTTIDEQINQQMEDNKELVLSKDNILNKMTFHKMIRFFVFDLYRFYHLMPQHRQFLNPFEHDIKFQSSDFPRIAYCGVFESACTNERLENMGEVFMRNGLYYDACCVFEDMEVEVNEENCHYFQKLAFCKEMCDDDNCINDYKTAYSLDPHSVWTLKHIISRLMLDGSTYEDCEPYIKELLDIEPENTKCLYDMIQCLTYRETYEGYKEALDYIYKLQYIAPETHGLEFYFIECLIGTNNLDKLCEVVIGSDDYNKTIIGALIFIKEENYIGAHELLKMAWEQWAKDTSKDKDSFYDTFNDVLHRMHWCEIDDTLANMLYDATILR